MTTIHRPFTQEAMARTTSSFVQARKKVLASVLTVLSGLTFCGGVAAQSQPLVQFLNPASSSTPFSEAVKVGNLLYVSGQMGLQPNSPTLAPGGIEPETKQAMENLKATLERYGYSLKDVVKCTGMLADMKEFGSFNTVYLSYFSKPYPARSVIGVNGLAFGGRVEIECIAAK